MPSAVPRSRPRNSCAISASDVANMAAPPIPCTARLMSSSNMSMPRHTVRSVHHFRVMAVTVGTQPCIS
jgi:hypothetical protein